MKKLFLSMMIALVAVAASAKDIKTLVVTTQPVMHCNSCEEKIKNNLRFEKGIKSIETDIPNQAVTITYDADKNNPEKIMKAFGKFGYTASEKTADEKGTATCEHKDCGHKDCSENHQQCEGEHKSCDGNKQCEGESKNCCGNKQCEGESKSCDGNKQCKGDSKNCCGNKQCEGEHKK